MGDLERPKSGDLDDLMYIYHAWSLKIEIPKFWMDSMLDVELRSYLTIKERASRILGRFDGFIAECRSYLSIREQDSGMKINQV